ncbi:MAG: phosphoglycolate/pyridoxal phosphate family phosphatase [Armatimonadota bacterium]|nr:phosphoglycolate/pyridoxal phosphate family phosphatase [Armatimonadota bacterium]
MPMQNRQHTLFIFDLDGVIYRGDSVLPYAADAIAALRAAGVSPFFFTNNSTRTRESYARKLSAMGIPARVEEIMTSAYATALYFQEQGLSGSAAYVVGEEGIVDELSRVGVRVVLGEDIEDVQSVVVGLDREFTYHKLLLAQQAIRRGARFIATNGDLTFPIENGKVIPGGGSLVAAVQAASGKTPVVIGKPELYALHKILELTGRQPCETTLVGDRLDTDVLGGRRVGFRTVLVLTGVTTAEEAAQAPAEMRPDRVLSNLSRLPELL